MTNKTQRKDDHYRHATLQQWLFILVCAFLLIFIGAITV